VEVIAQRAPGDYVVTALLETRGLSKRFGGLVAVNNVSLMVERGEMVGLFGPNGAGKTTTFNLIAGVLAPDDGRILLDGVDVVRLPPFARARRGIARTFQTVRPFRHLTVTENLLAAVSAQDDDPETRAAGLLREIALADRANDAAGTLPLGMLKRLEVARALMTGPRLLLLDEPLAGLSEAESIEMLRLVQRMKACAGIILVEHNVRLALPACDHAIVMDAGAVLARGVPAAIRRDPAVVRAYLGEGA
jgi:branched-chain amino acid transport system ATP-binding protein